MPIGHDGRKQARRSARARSATRRRVRRARLIALLLVLLPCALLLASTVSASASNESALAERQARAALRAAEHLARHEANQAANQAKREAAAQLRTEHEEIRHPNGGVVISCNQVTWNYKLFPDTPSNTVQQQVTIDHDHSTRLHSTFTFDGPTGTTITPLDGHAGRYQVDASASFTIEGRKLHWDIYKKVTCPPAPALTIQKLQRIGAAGPFTTSTLIGEVGQTVEYEIVVSNSGNIPVTLSPLTDPRCDVGTVAGGPGGALAIGESTTFTCAHVLTVADQTAGSYANTASETATPVGEGSPVNGESNTVVVEVPGGEVQPEKEKGPETPDGTPTGSNTPTSATTSPTSGVLAQTGSSGLGGTTPKTGVLASKTTAIPSLSGPHGCVRSSFKASVRSAGVRSVGFYMDKHKLKSMTARSARKGRLTITINPSTLSVGAHKLLAKITMVPTSSGAKARHATRSMTVLRCSSAVLTPRFTG
jgi:hypothetical protein